MSVEMNNMFATFKKELAQRHPDGTTYEEINKFCDEHPILCHSRVRADFITYISRAGE